MPSEPTARGRRAGCAGRKVLGWPRRPESRQDPCDRGRNDIVPLGGARRGRTAQRCRLSPARG